MSTAELTRVKRSRTFGGWTEYYRHPSESCGGEMRFSIYLPPQAERERLPVVYWLSGLTCTEENFMAKAGAQQWAAASGLILVAPDTSPRDTGIEGARESYDFGEGAGFYVNAVQEPWAGRFRMFDYVSRELPALIREHFPVREDRESIFGHSMGGHGALVLALRQPGRYRSVSAFAPIAAPSECPWGKKAFSRYLGSDENLWAQYDASRLLETVDHRVPILVDQGTEDEFLDSQLFPQRLEEAARKSDFPLQLRRQEGYDHSYYFIASFMKEHVAFHAAALKG